MVKKCKEKNCNDQPSYNLKGETKSLYCSKHKKQGMINVTTKRCLECDIIPSYNLKGEKKPLYCLMHKKEGMVNIRSKKCVECDDQPSYNLKGEKNPLYCLKHKKQGMVNIKDKKCVECNTRPNFNLKGETKPLYCSKHKKQGMIIVTTKRCLECNTLPSFNLKGETKPLYCSKHKKDGMIDIRSKRCIECDVIATFNIVGEKNGLYCSEHKIDGMISVKNKTCLECNIQASFNVKGQKKSLYCAEHKKDGMINIKSNICKSEWCSTQARTKKYDGYCLFCYINLFPDKPVSRNYKTKEYSVVEFVKTKFPHFDFIADKIISGGCSRRRPDLFLDILYQIIIIEVDENQHPDYDCTCENKRIMELSQDLGHRPIVFIRFNPDDYKKDGKNITSCWGCDKNGICIIKKSKQKEWLERLNTLEDQIKYWTDPENMTDKTIEIIQLYYDE